MYLAQRRRPHQGTASDAEKNNRKEEIYWEKKKILLRTSYMVCDLRDTTTLQSALTLPGCCATGRFAEMN